MGVAGQAELAYVTAVPLGSAMPQIADIRLRTPGRPLLLAAGAVCGALLAATLGLWAYYGTTVFFETVAAGLARCF